MATLAEVQSRIETLKKLKASGVLETRFGGRSVRYRSQAELDAEISDLERQEQELDGKKPTRQIRTFTSKGL